MIVAVRGSIRNRVPVSSLVTHTAPAPIAIALGGAPRWMTLLEPSARTRTTVRSTAEAIHTAPSPAASALGGVDALDAPGHLVGHGADLRDRAVAALGNPQRAVAERQRGGIGPDRDRHDAVAAGLDARDRLVVRVGHPDGTGPDCERARLAAEEVLGDDVGVGAVDPPDRV